jgi:DNA-binding NarL/FixJ family response regulator
MARSPHTLGPETPAPKELRIVAGALALLACMLFFAIDVLIDIQEHFAKGHTYTGGEAVHLVFELAAVVALGYGAWTMRTYVLFLRKQGVRDHQTIALLQGRFESVLQDRFEDWALTAAERDVTNLIIKGLSVADIAAARNTAPGTVKAQSTALFRKIGVSSKAELMSTILDEFLDTSEVDHVG